MFVSLLVEAAMCRIFAFKSRVSLKVQRSLVKAENALQVQSEAHPHGWGISYYLIETDDDAERISVAIEEAERTQKPVAVLVGTEFGT